MLRIQLEAQKRNYSVSIPTTEERYDLILDTGKGLFRTQVKYLNRLHSNTKYYKHKKTQCSLGSLDLSLVTNINSNKRHRKGYSKDEIDLLLVFIPIVDSILAYHPDQFHSKKSIVINLRKSSTSTYYKKFLW